MTDLGNDAVVLLAVEAEAGSVGVSLSTTASIPGRCLVDPLGRELGRVGTVSSEGEGVVILRERLLGRRAAGLPSVGTLLAAGATDELLSEIFEINIQCYYHPGVRQTNGIATLGIQTCTDHKISYHNGMKYFRAINH